MQRRLIWVTVAIVVTALCHARKVHATAVQDGCSVASLKGTYAFLISGTNTTMGGPVANMGLDVFNGDGTRGVIRATGSSLDGSFGWTDSSWPNGSYTVDPDCTGSIFDANDPQKIINIIVLDGGKRFLVLAAGPPETPKVVTGEATRLKEEKD